MTNDYKEVTSFEEIVQSINTEIVDDKKHLNFTRYFELPRSSLVQSDSKTENTAKQWMAFEKPEDLLFNHGEYIKKEGFEHIITELTTKPSSNRALYSLLNYQDICGQGDHPIPSFLLFQVTIEEGILYATSYFRALEVANFFKINAQEIKLNLLKIIENCPFDHVSKVRVTIHAFNAYKKVDQKIPKIFEIDRVNNTLLSRYVYKSTEHANLIRLIMEKEGADTYISTAWVRQIIDILTHNSDLIDNSTLKNNISNLLHKFKALLGCYEKLIELRKRASHSEEINTRNEEANNLIDDIVRKMQ